MPTREQAVSFAPRPRADRGVIAERARLARQSLRSCELCELRCGANRQTHEPAPCGLTDETWSFKHHISYAEELELLPSDMVYWGGCNFRCRFCVQAPRCFVPNQGTRVEAEALVVELENRMVAGVKTINLLGGEPSLHLPLILEIAAAAEQPLPLVLNSNMYMTPQVLDLLESVIVLYIADFKFGNDACATELARVPRYVEVVTRNLRAAAKQADMIIRHLLMPGHLECCFLPVARWVAENLPDVPFNLMTSYVPAWRAVNDKHLGRTVPEPEVAQAMEWIDRLSLRRNGNG